jgi:hypothetical protein
MAPFRVNSQWIEYAHGPGAEDGQPLATELVSLPVIDGAVLIPGHRRDLVAEVLDVAELYAFDTDVQNDDRLWWRAYPGRLINRSRQWLARAAAVEA